MPVKLYAISSMCVFPPPQLRPPARPLQGSMLCCGVGGQPGWITTSGFVASNLEAAGNRRAALFCGWMSILHCQQHPYCIVDQLQYWQVGLGSACLM